MRGPIQESRRIPHALIEVPGTPMAHKGWVVELRPINGDVEAVRCPQGRTIADAVDNADAFIAKNFPGSTL